MIVLTSLSKLIKISFLTYAFLNYIEEWIHSICSNGEKVLVKKIWVLGLETIIRSASILAIILNKKVAKIKTSFLAIKFVNTWRHNNFLITVLVNQLAWVFFVPILVSTTAGSIKNIDHNGWSRFFSFLFSITIIAVFFLFFSSILIGIIGVLKGCWLSFLVSRLRFLDPKIFHLDSLMASLIIFYKLFTIDNILIYYLEYKKRQKSSFELNINSFLY